MFRKVGKQKPTGQALVEFALIAIVLFLFIFLIIELGRILWAWVTVQNAARAGARYAITGQYESDCLADPTPCDDPRVVAIEGVALERLTGLRLNEDPDRQYEDDFAYFIEIYGINESGILQGGPEDGNFGGIPGQPMVVRVIYNVPIITPVLSSIASNVPVVGQVVQQNELFGQTGAVTTGQSIAPALPAIPTAGPTPTPTPTNTPTSTASATPGPSPTASFTPTPTETATPEVCQVRYEEPLIELDAAISISGDEGTEVRIVDVTAGVVIGTGIIGADASDVSVCDGFAIILIDPTLIEGHQIAIEDINNSFNTAFDIVLAGTATPTPVPTFTPIPTETPTPTPSTTPTATPSNAFLQFDGSGCGSGPDIREQVRGFNWGEDNYIAVYWDSNPIDQPEGVIPPDITGDDDDIRSFQILIDESGITTPGDYTVYAREFSSNPTTNPSQTPLFERSIVFEVPCSNITPTPSPTPPPATPIPADLIIVGPPVVNQAAPIIGYQPISFTVQITNDGEVDVNSQFFVDVYFDTDPGDIEPEGIDINFSSGYAGVSGLSAKSSKTITVTSFTGFPGLETDRTVYAMVDSVKQIDELVETNNLSTPIPVVITPGATPTPSPTPEPGSNDIAGLVYALSSKWLPQGRADVFLVLVEGGTGNKSSILRTTSDLNNGVYFFLGVPELNGSDYYEIVACFDLDGTTNVGTRSSVTPPNLSAHVYTFTDPTGCPYARGDTRP